MNDSDNNYNCYDKPYIYFIWMSDQKDSKYYFCLVKPYINSWIVKI